MFLLIGSVDRMRQGLFAQDKNGDGVSGGWSKNAGMNAEERRSREDAEIKAPRKNLCN
jgi:hypothetical protein